MKSDLTGVFHLKTYILQGFGNIPRYIYRLYRKILDFTPHPTSAALVIKRGGRLLEPVTVFPDGLYVRVCVVLNRLLACSVTVPIILGRLMSC